ncbi:MAG: hypothetical protein ACYCPQ_05775 [Elusimicrobiota bacterium]
MMSSPLIQKILKGISVSGHTLAPVNPPDPFTLRAWTARMDSDARQARALGWIKADADLKKIQALIAALNTNDKRALKKAVNNLSDYVLAEKKAGRLTSEADALARLNALYLLKRVEQDPKLLSGIKR